MTPPKPEEAGDRNGNDGIALTALPYGALTSSIINLPSIFDKAWIERRSALDPLKSIRPSKAAEQLHKIRTQRHHLEC